jgi:hypothetical protein
MKNTVLFIIVTLFFFSCSGDSTYHFYSPNKGQCFTIKTNNDTRYIIEGYHSSVPKSNYVKLDISKVDRVAGDQIVGCWNRDRLEWTIAMDKITVLENTLDSSRFKFLNHFPVDSQGIPTLKDYIGEDCFSISLEYRDFTRVEGSIKSD